jgi:hypothetical protein
MRAETYDRLDEVPETLWSAVAPQDFFFTRAFLGVMEASGVENARYRYVVLHVGDEPVGLAVLSHFRFRLDLLADDPWVTRLRRFVPRLFDVAVVCCGVPASLGQHHLHVVRPELKDAALRAVHECMEAWAEQSRASLLVFKEYSEDQRMHDIARATGYIAVPTLPDHSLPDLPATEEEYLGSMRSSYRRKYKPAVALMQGPGPLWSSGPLRLEEAPFTHEAADEFLVGYLALMERAAARLEVYTPQFFHGLADSTLDTRQLRLSNTENGESLIALMLACGDVLTFALVAKDHAKYEDALYTVLLRCIALYAIRGGFTQVRMGQTSGYAKVSVGARPRRLEAYIRVRGKLRHKAVERFGSDLFPEEESPDLSVFKEAADAPLAARQDAR